MEIFPIDALDMRAVCPSEVRASSGTPCSSRRITRDFITAFGLISGSNLIRCKAVLPLRLRLETSQLCSSKSFKTSSLPYSAARRKASLSGSTRSSEDSWMLQP